MPKTLVVVYGPTGVGKTDLCVDLAQWLGCDIVSADSRQVFRELNIGVARPTEADLAAVQHWFIASHSVRKRFSSGQYEQEALAVLEALFQRQEAVIATGGSMLYLHALCHGLDDYPPPDMALRARLNATMACEGVAALAEQLREADPVSWARIDLQNGARVLRALEVSLQTGIPFSQWQGREAKVRPFRIVKLGLTRPWPELRERIGQRVQAMMAQGLLDEVRSLIPLREHVPLKSVGYSEMFDYLDGACSLQEATERIVTNTYRYAKRQMRWWQRDEAIRWFHPSQREAIMEHLGAELEPLGSK